MKIKQDFKYKIVKNFLTKEEIGLLKDYAILRHRHNTSEFDDAQSNNVADFATYADPIMESLLLQKKTLMEKETGQLIFQDTGLQLFREVKYISLMKMENFSV